ncbi:MAG TPA: VWA domain-containing protein [Candidatus Polarisedimenticolaceae bacterium]
MRSLPTALALFVVVARATPAAPAAVPAAERPTERNLVERVTVRLIQLNFVAVEDDGRPVTDLRAEEVELRIDGVRTPLAFLQGQSPSPVTPEPRPGGLANPEATPPLDTRRTPGGVPTDADRGRWIVFLFDHVQASPRTRVESLLAAESFLMQRLRPADRVAIAVFDSRLRFVQNFTRDRSSLLATIEGLRAGTPRASAERARAIDQLILELQNCRDRGASATEQCANRVVTSYADDRVRELDAFASALRWVLYAVAGVPEAKTVVVFSEGVSRDPSRDGTDAAAAVLGIGTSRTGGAASRFETEERFDEVAEAASLAKAAVFTINPGGAPRMTSLSAARPGTEAGAGNALQIDPWRSAERNAQQSLQEISWRTGGIAAQGADVLAELERIDAVSAALYTLGYYASDGEPAERKVKIRVLRKDVKAEFQRDIPPPPPDRAPIAGQFVLESGACDEAGRRPVTLRLRLDRSSLAFTRLAGKFVANFSMFLRIAPGAGGPPDFEDFRTLSVSSPVREHESGRPADPTVEQRLTLPCRAYTAILTVTDAGSGSRREFVESIAE